MEFAGAARPLTDGDIAAEAARLGCEPAAIRAVCEVESAGRGFLPDGRPKILFEAHLFGRLTGHRWDATHPSISAPRWNRALYGPGGGHQYDRLAAAMRLDRTAALESASWGMFQILGLNFGRCGFAAVEAFVTAMGESEGRHLLAFGEFCRSGGLDRFLCCRDWVRFALGYNGPAAAANDYEARLSAAYRRRARLAAAAGPPAADDSDSEADALNRQELARLT